MNITGIGSVCLWSENPDELAEFYEKILGLSVDQRMNLPDDTGILFKVGNVYFFVGYHDKIVGNAKDPYRVMIGFDVPSVQAVYDEIAPKNVEFIQLPSLSPDKTFYVATAKDPEGNVIQFYSNSK